MELINELILQAVASPWLYLVLFAVTVIDGFFPPVPSETVLVAAAAVTTSTGQLWMLAPLGVVAALGAVAGDNVAFALGRRTGTARWKWMRRPRIASAFDHAGRALERHSAALLLGARYVPVGRVAVNMSAGALGFPWRRFLPLSLAAGASWSVLSLAIGLFAGVWVRDQPLLGAAIGIVIAISIGVVVDRIAAVRRSTSDAHPAR